MSFMITQQQKETLRGLGYSEERIWTGIAKSLFRDFDVRARSDKVKWRYLVI